MRERLQALRWWALLAILLVIASLVCAIWVDNIRVTLALGFASITVAILSRYEERP